MAVSKKRTGRKPASQRIQRGAARPTLRSAEAPAGGPVLRNVEAPAAGVHSVAVQPPPPAGFRKSAEDLVREKHQDPDEPQEEEVRDMMARIAAARAPGSSWRPACTPCVHRNKAASSELSGKLAADGTAEGSPEWLEAMNQATIAGQQAFQEGKEIPAGALPPVRQADLLVNGTGVCVACFRVAPDQPPQPAPGRSGSGLIVG